MSSMPTVPTFTQGESGLTNLYNLQSLANCVSFLTNVDYAPAFHLFRTATQTVTAATTSTITFNQVSYDPSGMSNGTGVTIPMAGIYSFKAVVPLETNAVTGFNDLLFLVTFGANNPNFTSGINKGFGGRSTESVTTAATDTVLSTASACPWDLYPGDQVIVQVYNPGAVLTMSINNNSTAWQGRVVPSFFGRWLRTTH